MKWPDAPTTHAGRRHIPGMEQDTWRPPNPEGLQAPCECGYEQVGPYGYPFRTCSYCGSMHPEDLARWLKDGASLRGSDWKHGYPHKFYVEGIPNPLAGRDADSMSRYVPLVEGQDPDSIPVDPRWPVDRRVVKGGDIRFIHDHSRSPAPPHSWAKFYTDHLKDEGYDVEALDLLLPLLSERTGIIWTFEWDDAMQRRVVKYRAPHFGYQR